MVQKYREKRSGDKVIRHGEESQVTVCKTTINKEVSALRKLNRLAAKKGIQTKVTTYPMAKEPSRNFVLSAEQYKKLLEKCEPWLRRACVMAYETSLSRSDLLNLRWPQIDFEQGIISGSRAKTGVVQKTPIVTPELWAVLDELKAERQKVANTGGLVFTINGQRIPENLFEYYFRRARKVAGLPTFRFHDLRHCAITRWAAAGVPTAAAMLAAGHSSLARHKKYQNPQNDELKNAFAKLLFPTCSREKSEEKESAASA